MPLSNPELSDFLWAAGRYGSFDNETPPFCALRVRAAGAIVSNCRYSDSTGAAFQTFSDAALAAVKAVDFDTIPWGKLVRADYGGGGNVIITSIPTPTFTTYDIDDTTLSAEMNGLSSEYLTSTLSGSGPFSNEVFSFIKLQIVTTNPWMMVYDFAGSSGIFPDGFPNRSCSCDFLTVDSTDANNAHVTFKAVNSNLINLPIPKFKGFYSFLPSQNFIPHGAAYDNSGNYVVSGAFPEKDVGIWFPEISPVYFWAKGINDLTCSSLTATGSFNSGWDATGASGDMTITGVPNAPVTCQIYFANNT